MDKITEKTGNYRNPDGTFAVGNPGRPAGIKNFTTKVREALEKIAEGKDYTYEEAFIKALLKKAIVDQDTRIMTHMWDHFDGKPLQKTDITTQGEKIESQGSLDLDLLAERLAEEIKQKRIDNIQLDEEE